RAAARVVGGEEAAVGGGELAGELQRAQQGGAVAGSVGRAQAWSRVPGVEHRAGAGHGGEACGDGGHGGSHGPNATERLARCSDQRGRPPVGSGPCRRWTSPPTSSRSPAPSS